MHNGDKRPAGRGCCAGSVGAVRPPAASERRAERLFWCLKSTILHQLSRACQLPSLAPQPLPFCSAGAGAQLAAGRRPTTAAPRMGIGGAGALLASGPRGATGWCAASGRLTLALLAALLLLAGWHFPLLPRLLRNNSRPVGPLARLDGRLWPGPDSGGSIGALPQVRATAAAPPGASISKGCRLWHLWWYQICLPESMPSRESSLAKHCVYQCSWPPYPAPLLCRETWHPPHPPIWLSCST